MLALAEFASLRVLYRGESHVTDDLVVNVALLVVGGYLVLPPLVRLAVSLPASVRSPRDWIHHAVFVVVFVVLLVWLLLSN